MSRALSLCRDRITTRILRQSGPLGDDFDPIIDITESIRSGCEIFIIFLLSWWWLRSHWGSSN